MWSETTVELCPLSLELKPLFPSQQMLEVFVVDFIIVRILLECHKQGYSVSFLVVFILALFCPFLCIYILSFVLEDHDYLPNAVLPGCTLN